MNLTDITTQRLHNQGLLQTRFASPEEVVRWNVAVQSQDYPGAKWTLGQRVEDVTDADLDRLFDEGVFLRTHVLRPTWHFVLPEDLRWLLALTTPRIHAANKGRYRDLELDESTLAQSRDVIERTLKDSGPLTRRELGTSLEAAGIATTGQRLTYLVMYAELEAAICNGPRRGKQHTYMLLDERVPPGGSLDREEAIATLADRYVMSHGPATPHDFAWWTGLTVTDARRALDAVRDRLECLEIDGVEWWMTPVDVPEHDGRPFVHLLQAWDEYVVGFHNHEPAWDPEVRALQTPKGPLWNANLLAANGIVMGGWRREITAKELRISPILPSPLGSDHAAEFERETEAYGRFLGREAKII